MKSALQRLKAIVKHPAMQLATGLVLIVSGMVEIVYDFLDAERSFQWGVHHGVAIFGLIQVLGSLPDLIEGISRAMEATEKRRE